MTAPTSFAKVKASLALDSQSQGNAAYLRLILDLADAANFGSPTHANPFRDVLARLDPLIKGTFVEQYVRETLNPKMNSWDSLWS